MTYREAYTYGEQLLAAAGIAEASIDARLLLEEICRTNRNDLLVHGDRVLTEDERTAYRLFLKRREKHEPLQQIVGYQEFMGLCFAVTRDVLVPRQDTENLVEEVMRYLRDGMRILDVCTGSGCILLSLLHYSNDCIGVGCDISKEALAVAAGNAEALSISAEWIQSDLLERIDGTFEYIVSNPPYIRTDVITDLMPEVKEFEPRIALDGGTDGLYFYREIVREAVKHLTSGGMLFFEIGYDQGEAVSGLLRDAGFDEVTVCKDFSGLDRVVHGTWNR